MTTNCLHNNLQNEMVITQRYRDYIGLKKIVMVIIVFLFKGLSVENEEQVRL